MEILATAVILLCFGVGAYYQFFSEKIDSMPEQVAEKVLEKYDIEYDFSLQKKKELEKKKQAAAQEGAEIPKK